MARTPSVMVELGTRAPDFNLPDTDGKKVSLTQFQGKKGLLVVFMCNHCPYVKHIRAELASVTRDLMHQDIGVVGINSNDVQNYPDDSPEMMKVEKREAGYAFPYLFDATQSVAEAYQAACTPDFFLFDDKMRLYYRGQFDDSRPNSGIPVTGQDLVAAAKALVDGKPAPKDQKPSLGCNIKWKQ